MRFFQNLKMKSKLIVIMTVPLLVFAVVLISYLLKMSNDVKNAEKVNKLIGVISGISDVVHETQKERGMTSGFLGSNGKLYGEELKIQRQVTDEKIKIFINSSKKINVKEYGKDIEESYNKSINMINQLPDIRKKLDSFEINTADAINFYNQMNDSTLRIIEPISKISPDEKIFYHLKGYLMFLLAKERMGIERAVLNNAFSADKFNSGIFIKFSSLITKQELFIKEFKFYASKNQKEYLEKNYKEKLLKKLKG